MKKTVMFLVFVLALSGSAGALEKIERENAVTMKGKPVTLIGPEIQAGQAAPDFTVQAGDLSDVSLKDFEGRVKIIASVPSVDTPVCDLEIKRFNEEAAKLSGDVSILVVSMDLPFAQKRFCGGAGIEHVKVLSDHRTAEFGESYGVLIKELRLLSRAVFVVDKSGKVRYAEYVKETGTHPHYDAVLAAVRELPAAG